MNIMLWKHIRNLKYILFVFYKTWHSSEHSYFSFAATTYFYTPTSHQTFNLLLDI